MVQIEVLGPLTAWQVGEGGKRRLDIGDRRRRALLAMLTMARGGVVSVDSLVAGLWGSRRPSVPVAAVQAYVSHLRRSFEPAVAPRARTGLLVREPTGYALRLPADAVDAWRFQDLVATATTSGDAASVCRDLDLALELWRGPAYIEVADQPWATDEVARLNELRVLARERWCAAALTAERVTDAVLRSQQLTRDHPLREEGWRLHALALYAAGRQAEALDTLRAARGILVDELGLDPGPALARLEFDILRQRTDLAPVTDPALPSLRRPDSVFDASREPFVGREAEVETLLDAAAQAREAPTTRVVFVTGDPGAGKSAVLRRAAEELSSGGWHVVLGRCPESGVAPPAWAWAEVVRALAQHVDPGPLTSALAPLLRDDAVGTEPEPSYGRFMLTRAVADFVTACARRRPLAILIDDVHRADSQTLALTTFVADHVRGVALLVVGAYRQREMGEYRAASLAALDTAPPQRLSLDGLPDTAAAKLVTDICGADADANTVRTLVERTGGNPFYLRESALLLRNKGADAAMLQVPEGIRDVLQRRFARLPHNVVDVLRLAAVLGRDVDLETLVAAAMSSDGSAPSRKRTDRAGGSTPGTDESVLEAVGVAEQAGFLLDAGPGLVRFAHVLVVDTLYHDMPESRRARSHARVATALARYRPADVAALAHHLYRSGTTAAARASLDAATAAAEQAMARYAPEVAADLYQQAIRALDRLDPPDGSGAATVELDSTRVQVLSRLSVAQLAAGAGEAALDARAVAIGVAERSGDDRLLVTALSAWDLPTAWSVRPYGVYDGHLTALLERSLTVADVDVATRCRLLYALVREVAGQDQDRAHRAASEAEQLARDLGDAYLLGLALHARGVTLLHDADLAARLPLAEELIGISRSRGLAAFALIGHEFVVQEAATRADVATLVEAVDQLDSLVRTYRWQRSAGMLEGHRGLIAHIRGDLAGADRHYRSMAEILRGNGGLDANRIAGIAAFSLAMTAGHPEALEPLLASFQPPPREALDMFAVVLAAAGKDDEARRFHGARPPIRSDFFRPLFLVIRGLAAVALRDGSTAAEVYGQLRAHAGQLAGATTGVFGFGPVDTVLGDLAALGSDRLSAARHYTDAQTFARRCGSQLWADTAGRRLAAL